MEEKSNIIEPLLEKAEQYAKTSFELFKLKSLDKTADVTATLISRVFFLIALSIFTITINIAIALWLGELLGKTFYGFLIIGGFYGLLTIVLFFLHHSIKKRVNSSIIQQMFK